MLHASNHGPTPSTIFVALTDGTSFTIRDTYSETQSRAVIVRRVSAPLIRAFPLIPKQGTHCRILCFVGRYRRAVVCDCCASQV